jgi:hypothetical protein
VAAGRGAGAAEGLPGLRRALAAGARLLPAAQKAPAAARQVSWYITLILYVGWRHIVRCFSRAAWSALRKIALYVACRAMAAALILILLLLALCSCTGGFDRWFQLQKLWQKTFPSQAYKTGTVKQLPQAVRDFLMELNSSAVAVTRQKAESAAAKSMAAQNDCNGARGGRGRSGSDASRSPAVGSAQHVLGNNMSAASGSGSGYNGGLQGQSARPGGPQQLPSIPASAAVPMPAPMSLPAPLPFPAAGMQPFGVPGAPGGFPTTMPPFMMPPFMAMGGRVPTTPAELQVYQQQMQQYTQFMMAQMYMMAQHQQLLLQQQSQQQAQSAQQHLLHNGYFNSASVAQNAVNHAGGGHAAAPYAELNVNGPPLLGNNVQQDVPDAKNKRPRRNGPDDHTSAVGTTLGSNTAQKSFSAGSTAAAGPTGSGSGVGAHPNALVPASTADDMSRGGFSFLHDADSLFSLLMPGNSIAFVDPSVSIPMLDSESGASNSISREGSLLSRVKAAADAAGARSSAAASSLFASLQAAAGNSLRNAQSSTTSDGSASATTTHSAPGTSKTTPAASGDVSAAASVAQASSKDRANNVSAAAPKPIRKTIKPMLISAGTAQESKRASPAFTPTSSAFVSSVSAFQSVSKAGAAIPTAQSSSSSTAATASGGRTGSSEVTSARGDGNRVNASPSKSTRIAADAVEPTTYSNMCWPDMRRRSSGGTGEESLHSPLLEDISMMDASKFAFSSLTHNGQHGDASRSLAGSKSAAGNGGGVNGEGKKKKRKYNNALDPLGSTATASNAAAATAGAGVTAPNNAPSTQFAFDETSNMSILGDMFGDGDMSVPGHTFSNMTHLLGLLSPQKASRGASRGSSRGAAAHTHSHTGAAGEKAGNKRQLETHSAQAGSGSTKVSAGSGSAKKPKLSGGIAERQGGIFAEVMAKAQKTHK